MMDTPLLSRRDWLSWSSTVLAAAGLGVPGRKQSATPPEELVLNSRGGYRFLPGVPFLSFGAQSTDGFEIARTIFREARPFQAGMAEVQQILGASGRPIHALCGLELRSPRPLSFAEFDRFNQAYLTYLKQAGLLVGEQVPITRTNVAFAGASTGEPAVSIHAFSYTVARRQPAVAPTFVLAGMPEIRNLRLAALRLELPDIVALNDTTPAGLPTSTALRLKTEFVLSALDETMSTFGVQWADVTGLQLYTVHDVQPLVAGLILPHIGVAARYGIEWHHVRPPGAQVEIGVRGIHLESVA